MSDFRPRSGRGWVGEASDVLLRHRQVQLTTQHVANICSREEELSINKASISDGKVMTEVEFMPFFRPVNKRRLKSITVMISQL